MRGLAAGGGLFVSGQGFGGRLLARRPTAVMVVEGGQGFDPTTVELQITVRRLDGKLGAALPSYPSSAQGTALATLAS